MESPIILYLLIGIIIFLCLFIVFLMYTNYQHQKTYIKAILSRDVHDFKSVTEPALESSGNVEDKLIPLSELSDADFDKLVLNAKQ